MENDKGFKAIADKILQQMKDGTSPLLKRWESVPTSPMNPVSGTVYKGINNLSLAHEQRDDPRWMTYKQAASKEYQVRKGETGNPIVFWQFHKQVNKKDDAGKIIMDKRGKPVKVNIRLARPRVFHSTVFNAEQMDNVPAMEEPPKLDKFDIHARAEGIIKESGADISYGGDRAFYSMSTDKIQLPEREYFKSEGDFYATSIHELSHWTGHESRLDRELGNKFGSPEYAREELRAEITSYMMSGELNLPFDPGQHVSYIDNWVKALEEKPLEIYQASRDAEQMKTYVLQYDRTLEQDKEIEQVQEQITPAINVNTTESLKAKPDTNSFGETGVVKTDSDTKEPAIMRSIDVVQDLKKSCEAMGLQMDKNPVLDGRFHRVPVNKNGKANTDGSYKAYSDGIPAGVITNHYTGQTRKWKASGMSKELTQKERQDLARRASENVKTMQAKVDATHSHKARRVEQLISVMPKATDNNSYLKHKGISASSNVYEDKKGRLVVPVTDVKGKAQSMVRINATGSFKGNLAGGKMKGGMHMIGKPEDGKPIIVAEGYSTGKSLNEATGRPVAVAFNSSNLGNVAHAVQQAYTAATVFVAGDDDRQNDRNAGRIKATEAAKGVETQVILPKFPPGAKGSDFNDLAKVAGKAEVTKQVETGIKRGRSAEPHQQRAVKEKAKERVQERGKTLARSR